MFDHAMHQDKNRRVVIWNLFKEPSLDVPSIENAIHETKQGCMFLVFRPFAFYGLKI